ncbi:MAG: flagellar basal body L-ring protein FlgH [Planctomycetales bacterium]|nr:flagellar basal body L-ring protein FlgH [Planctomycetales bacterium]
MKRTSGECVKILVILFISVASLLSLAFAGWKLYDKLGGVRVDDVVTVRIRRPDGNVLMEMAVSVKAITAKGDVLFARDRRVRMNDEVWRVSLSGRFPRNAIHSDGIVESEDISDLELSKTHCDQDGFAEDLHITKHSGRTVILPDPS